MFGRCPLFKAAVWLRVTRRKAADWLRVTGIEVGDDDGGWAGSSDAEG